MSDKHEIKVKKEDIFLFVVGNSMFDPIEKCIDSTMYEVFDTYIYDNDTAYKYNQDEIYAKFCWEVTKLKNNAPQMSRDEIARLCEEIEEIAPKFVNLKCI